MGKSRKANDDPTGWMGKHRCKDQTSHLFRRRTKPRNQPISQGQDKRLSASDGCLIDAKCLNLEPTLGCHFHFWYHRSRYQPHCLDSQLAEKDLKKGDRPGESHFHSTQTVAFRKAVRPARAGGEASAEHRNTRSHTGCYGLSG